MKRLLVFAILACLLLSGCDKAEPTPTKPVQAQTPTTQTTPVTETPTEVTTTPVTETPTEATTTPATEAPTEPTEAPTEPAETVPETVVVYLLEKSFAYDSGSTEYYYDEDYNIDYYNVLTLEKEIMYTCYFEQKDANGMACKIRSQWPGESDYSSTLKYFADGKPEEELQDGTNYCGVQYAYDLKGDVIEKRSYYDGILESIVLYEYDGETLCAVYCEDSTGEKLYECRVENGLIVEKICYDYDGSSYSFLYEYDENGNLVRDSFLYDGELLPGQEYFYKAVEVDADRACYLLEQQKYLISIT